LEEQRTGKKTLREEELRWIQRLSPPGRLLDVGCGYGLFLERARQNGWHGTGVELSSPEWRYATEHLHLDVLNQSLSDARFADNSFDVVTLWEVIELLLEPEKVLREILRILKPGGWLMLRTNNMRFHVPALRAGGHPLLRPLRLSPGVLHDFGYTPESLAQGLRKERFGNIRSFPSPTTEGDVYRTGGRMGGMPVRAAKTVLTGVSRGLFLLSGGKTILSSAFFTVAQKPDTRPTIFHLITRLDDGGSTENVIASAQRVDPRRFRSLLGYGPTKKTPVLHSVPTLFFPDLIRDLSLRRDIRSFRDLHTTLRLMNPDIVHTHSSKAGLLGRWAARLAGCRRIVHTPHGHVFYGYFGWIKNTVFLLLERLTARITPRLIALTEGEKNESLAFGIGKEDQWSVIHSGVEWSEPVVAQRDGSRRRVRESFHIPEDACVIGTVARFEPVKGILHLGEAIERIFKIKMDGCENLYFLLVGDGSERLALETLRLRLPSPDHLILTGHQTDPFVYMTAMDIYVQPSLNEGMGKTLVMAQAMGLPVIASRVGGIPDVVVHEQTGILIPPADAHALAVEIEKLCHSPALRRSLGEAGFRRVRETLDGKRRFSMDRMIFLLETCYDDLLEKTR